MTTFADNEYDHEIEIREEEYEEDDEHVTTTERFDGCSFNIPNHYDHTEILSAQVPSHTEKSLWSMVNTHADQIDLEQTQIDYDDNVDEHQYTPYFSKTAVRIAEAVKDMQAKLGKFSLNKIADALNGGAIKNDEDFTRQQIITADHILGTDI